ncbi:MAG: hypothetical protein A2286_09995 [Gammaproteobacteria bacterium RIFOXYA12_FULL_61_12]|nr:MAG: hypothetical protein A2286_09995 [Gammaproteobacteria bacterium RIFOXYA12_FULL_61_12]OGT91333.1 MAG: hypothetical protein A2514_02685 [Gammaproteobacteria bacterium RIFOXYD12_FULL_61_37]
MKTYSHTLPVNEQIAGRYRIQGVLGEGGFGITYRAWDEHLERLVVIKEYLPGELGVRDSDTLTVIPRANREEDFGFGLKRYLDEAKSLARFQHPNIVRILDHLEAHGTAYIVMEYEEGETLAERLKRRRGEMGEEEILDLCLSLLNGLREVHKAGLLHRDIKPGNIFLRKSGEPLLIDFGAARHALGEHSKSISAIVSGGYAPPEQYSTRGKQGPFTDLYAIGAVLYELITGQAPLESVERSHHLTEGEPDPLSPAAQAGNGKAPDWLLTLNDRLLRVPSKERPQACDEVLREIRSHRVSREMPAVVSKFEEAPAVQGTRLVTEEERFGPDRTQWARERGPGLIAAGVLLAVSILGVTVYLLLGRSGERPAAIAGTQAAVIGLSSDGLGVRETVPPAIGAGDGLPPIVQAEAAPNEAEWYSRVSKIDTGFGYQLFLRKFPEGSFSEEARRRFNGSGP